MAAEGKVLEPGAVKIVAVTLYGTLYQYRGDACWRVGEESLRSAASHAAVGKMAKSARGEVRSANLLLPEPSRLSACEGYRWLWAERYAKLCRGRRGGRVRGRSRLTSIILV